MFCQNFWFRFLTTILLSGWILHLFGQTDYRSGFYTLKDGLSSEICRSLYKDKSGFLWISSDKGLNRFDGNSFYTFRHRPDDDRSIANNSCNGILEDRKGRLWINTDDGLSLFDRKKLTFQNFYPDTSVLPVEGLSYTDMAEDQKGNIWIGGYYDVLIFNPKTSLFEKSGWYDFAHRSGIIKEEKRNSITQSIQKKSETELWLMTVYGLFSVHTPTKTYTYHPNHSIEDYFAFVLHHIDQKGVLWIGTYDQCFYSYDPKTLLWTHFTCPSRQKGVSDMISDIDRYNEDILLMTRTDDLFLFDTKTGEWKPFVWNDKMTNLSTNFFFQTLLSGDDIYITGAGSQPFIHLSRKKPLIKKTKIPLPENTANNHSYLTPDGNILTGDWDKNVVFVCDRVLCTKLSEKNGNTSLGNLQLYYASDNGDHYFSTSKKVYQWNVSDHTVRLLSVEKNENPTEFRNFTEDNRGTIYVRERQKGIFFRKKGSPYFEHFDCRINDDNYSALYYDKATDKLWLASEKNGLYIIDPETRKFKNYPITHLAGTKKGFIYDISGDDRGNVFLLIANRGLLMINSRDMVPKLFTTMDGLQSDAVKYGTLHQNMYWFTSESGLMAFDYHKKRFYSFENEPDNKLFTYRIFPDREGNITQNLYPEQIITFDKNVFFNQKFTSKIYLKEAKLSGKIIPNDSLFFVPYDQNNFVFLFGNIGPSGLNHLEYQYRINGQSWQALDNSMIGLYNLAPGSYLIQVAHKYDEKNVFQLMVRVTPPWWKTTWFYTFMAVTFSVLIFGLYKKRISSIRKEEAEKNQLKQKISEIEMTALRAQMNPHFIFNCLNSINRFILVHDTEAASAYLTKFSRLIRLILDGSREDFITLDKEIEALRLYIEMESMRFSDSFEWKIVIDPDVRMENVLLPPLLLQPYVENAIWHGLMQAPPGDPKKLSIHIHQSEEKLIIEISDNGIGRKKALEIKSKDGNKHKSYGITLTEERLKLMEKIKGITTEVLIEDLVDFQQKASGTKVILYIHT
jgi:hypothetical protein